ncbi:hypothetical protein AVEN_211921-1 [Araneus ventricosus]|uniref:Uncharacterized protein n=1 Tax=Araneus ventricosus TaxID=182803 RepID=A0A4Y2JEJ2_ARAVE|nr:hypothetical protein AVEN_211921-1 [Araneus ventricosus]
MIYPSPMTGRSSFGRGWVVAGELRPQFPTAVKTSLLYCSPNASAGQRVHRLMDLYSSADLRGSSTSTTENGREEGERENKPMPLQEEFVPNERANTVAKTYPSRWPEDNPVECDCQNIPPESRKFNTSD